MLVESFRIVAVLPHRYPNLYLYIKCNDRLLPNDYKSLHNLLHVRSGHVFLDLGSDSPIATIGETTVVKHRETSGDKIALRTLDFEA